MKITDDVLYQHAVEARNVWLDAYIPNNSDIPEHLFSIRFNRKMKKIITNQRRSPQMKNCIIFAKKAVAISLIVIGLTFTSLMTVEAFREKIIDVVIQIFNELTDYRFFSEVSEVDSHLPELTFGYVPDSMTEVEQTYSPKYRFIRYEGDGELFFELSQSLITSGEEHHKIMDTENADIEEFYIHGEPAYVVSKNQSTSILWTNENVVFNLLGNLPLHDLKEIAEQLK